MGCKGTLPAFPGEESPAPDPTAAGTLGFRLHRRLGFLGKESRAQSTLSVCPRRIPTLNLTWEKSPLLREMTETPGVCHLRLCHTFGNKAGKAEMISLLEAGFSWRFSGC